MKEKLKEILLRVTGRDIQLEEGLFFRDDLGVDSLTMVEVVYECEETLGIVFGQEELTEDNLGTTTAFLKLLEGKCES